MTRDFYVAEASGIAWEIKIYVFLCHYCRHQTKTCPTFQQLNHGSVEVEPAGREV